MRNRNRLSESSIRYGAATSRAYPLLSFAASAATTAATASRRNQKRKRIDAAFSSLARKRKSGVVERELRRVPAFAATTTFAPDRRDSHQRARFSRWSCSTRTALMLPASFGTSCFSLVLGRFSRDGHM